jgi:hypothetical protein
MHGLLSDDMGVYREDARGNPVYNWQYIDALYDSLLSLGLKPFVELAFMPASPAEPPRSSGGRATSPRRSPTRNGRTWSGTWSLISASATAMTRSRPGTSRSGTSPTSDPSSPPVWRSICGSIGRPRRR